MSEDEKLPWLMRAIKEKFTDIKVVRNSIYAKPRTAEFDAFILRQREVLFERYWEFSALVNFFPNGVSKAQIKTCRRAKRMDCELAWKGFLRKTPYFRSSPELREFKKYFPSFSPSNALINRLHKNSKLISLIQKIKPEKLKVFFSFIPPLKTSFRITFDMWIKSYLKPSSLTGIIILDKTLWRNPGVQRTLNEIYEVLNIISAEMKNCATRGK
ncbi:hypothetical protein J7L27_01605 [Candidatus Bathyarchaeota archaeon]|nr:hypothetical protein [Candidatus Bathyarchaeota archaeon]